MLFRHIGLSKLLFIQAHIVDKSGDSDTLFIMNPLSVEKTPYQCTHTLRKQVEESTQNQQKKQ